MNKIRNEKGEVTTDNAEIQRIIRDCYEHLYLSKMDKPEETDRFLVTAHKKRKIKSTKLEMKKKLQQTMQKYKGW